MLVKLVYASGNIEPLIYKEYLGRGFELEYLPVTVLYDPYGDKSYQQISTETTITVTFTMKGGASGVIASGSTTTSVTYETTYQSSTSTDPLDMGPGKGDTIIGKVYNLTWDVWYILRWDGSEYYEYKLVSSQLIGTFVKSRSGLASVSDTYVEDKTGQVGSYRHFWDIDPNRPVEHTVTYSWTGTVEVGYEFKVNILGLINAELSFLLTVSGTQSYSVTCHYEDSSKTLRFYENAKRADPEMNTIYSYVFWYSPA